MTKLIGFALLLSVGAYSAPATGRYKAILNQLDQIHAANPDLTHLYSIGTNDEGVEIIAIRISTTPTVMDPKKVGHLVVSTHHGNESGAPVFTVAYIKDLIKRYRSQELFKGNLSDLEWTIVPVLNVSGYNNNRREERGIDPNREYANPCTNKVGPKLKSIQRVVELLGTRIFVGSVTVHGYDGSLTYPWGVYAKNDHTKDHNLYHQIFSKAATHNGYRVGTAGAIVYPANGCYEDWVYWKYGAWSLLLELASGSTNDINRTVPAIASFFSQLDSSPSTQHDFNSECTHRRGPDLRLE